MNIVFFGSAHFAAHSLRALLTTQHKISCVVTQLDRKKGRGLHLGATVIKEIARGAGLEVFQPERINSGETIKFLKDLNPDLFVVIAYGQILSRQVLGLPRIFAINVHASLLPVYRGAAPINWAIIKGESKTGITVIKMSHQMDAGPIILQEAIDIPIEDTAVTLEDKLAHMGARLLLSSIISIENNKYSFIPQDTDKVSFAPKLKKEDGLIRWDKAACDIHNLVRGCTGWPGAFTYYQGKMLKIHKTKIVQCPAAQEHRMPGEIINVSQEGIMVSTGKDNLIIEELQIEGKKRIPAYEFEHGHKISPGDSLGHPAPF